MNKRALNSYEKIVEAIYRRYNYLVFSVSTNVEFTAKRTLPNVKYDISFSIFHTEFWCPHGPFVSNGSDENTI